MKTKVCTKCGEDKPLTEFYRDSRRSDGLTSSCKKCNNFLKAEYRKANPEKMKARDAAYHKANLEKKKAYWSEYYKANQEKLKAYWAEYYKANPEKRKAYWAAYRAYQKEMSEMQEESGFEILDLNQGESC